MMVLYIKDLQLKILKRPNGKSEQICTVQIYRNIEIETVFHILC